MSNIATSELRYRRLFEAAQDAILILDAETGKIVDANPYIKNLLGYSHDGIIGKELWEIGLFKDISANKAAFLKLQEDKYIRYDDLPLERKNGGRIWVEFVSNVYSVNGLDVIQCNIRDITERKILENELRGKHSELLRAYDETIIGWAHALELRDRETKGHSERVVEMTARLAQAMNVGEEELTQYRRGALLHDIGKMGIPDSILLKDGPLTEDEWAAMSRHPELALMLLRQIKFLQKATDIPYSHHEKWDGTGYPRGLKGEEIPLSARIFSVVDVYDAMLSNRVYRAGMPRKLVLDYVRSMSGTAFDPKVVTAFLSMIEKEAGSGT